MIRFIIYGFIIYFAYRFIKSWGKSLFPSDGQDISARPPSEPTELVQDPQCGVYFLRQRGIEARIGGKVMSFCSQKCRDEYQKKHLNN